MNYMLSSNQMSQ